MSETFEQASIEQCSLAHNRDYLSRLVEKAPECALNFNPVIINFIRDPAAQPLHASQWLSNDASNDTGSNDTFMSHKSLEAAFYAAGAVCHAVDVISTENRSFRNVFCAVRPPGHHAGASGRTKDAPSQGYCLLNNVAIGACYAVQKHGYKRVLIFDFGAA